MAQAIRSPAIVGEEVHRMILRNELRVLLDKINRCIPERRDRLNVFQHRKCETWHHDD